MENLKIRVANSSESKEVQQLFFELGYGFEGCKIKTIQHLEYTSDYYFFAYAHDMDLTHSCDYGVFINKAHKEITIPELRDLVVLNRNDVGDATHTDPNEKESLYFRLFGDWWNLFTGGKWQQFCHMDSPRAAKLKPIEKKEMKEYLRKNNDGEYILEVTDEREAQEPHAKHWIEVPEGCNIITCENRKGNLVYFHWKSLDSDEFFLKDEKIWSNNFNETLSDFIEKNEGDVVIIWSRHTHPEELPFIDDEPLQSLNDQYAEIEKVRQSHRTASEIADSALKHIRERAETYDQPTGERSAAKTAKAFNAITGKDITESEVWLLLQLLKDVRQWSREDYHQDSAEDCIAYAALKAESLEGGE